MEVLNKFWMVTAEMAPYLLFGFVVAGLLSVVMTGTFVRRHLGGGKFMTTVKAALLGVPMPLCSCSVVPVTASLAENGAGKGATASFLASTPQTGVDSILVTHALLGPIYALIRVVVAFVSGILTGVAVTLVSSGNDSGIKVHEELQEKRKSWKQGVIYGLLDMPADIGKELFVGLFITALIGTFIEPGQFSASIGTGWQGMVIMLAAGIPIYVCSTASVPIAVGLIIAGFSPGAVLVFLIAGPATNFATVLTMVKVIGKLETVTYLITLMLTALASGLLVDSLPINESVQKTVQESCHSVSWFQHLCAVVLIILLSRAFIRKSKPREESCCCSVKEEKVTSCCSSSPKKNQDSHSCCG